jgi:pimeloyl-ACP methyl ester carboxylesterase
MRLGGEPWWRKVMTALQACGEDTRRHAKHQSLSRRNLFKAGAVVVAGPAVASGAIAATQSSSPPDLPSKSIMVGGFNQNVVDVGSGSAVLMLHGFPNDSTDWRHQIPELVNAGYRVIAPDLLGLGKSDKPLAPENYTTAKDAERALALLSSLGIERARVVGHDRGGGAAWYITAHHPDRVEQLVALTVGHSNGGRNPTIEQMEKSWYMLLFQFPEAEEMLKKDNWRLFRNWMRNHPDTDKWIAGLTPEGALTAGLGWYRANRRPGAPSAPPLPDVTVPALGLWTMEDHYLLPDYMLETYRYMRAPWRAERIDGASHFIMLDQPQRVTKLILEFFKEAKTK